MGVRSGLGKLLTAPLLFLNFALAVVILGLAGRVLDRGISGVTPGSGFEGNAATPYLIPFSLIAGVLAIASYITGVHHLTRWNRSSGAASHATAWIAWAVLLVAFGLAWKEIHLGGRGTKLKVLEAFVIILTVTHFIYTLALHIGEREYGNDNTATGRNPKPLNPNAPADTSAV